MSLDNFGLSHPPFRPQSSDGSIYAGSQQIALAGGLKRALASPDAVVTVSGEVGVGKTVSVRYALDRLGATNAIARIGRVHLAREEILDVLLDEFKVASKPASALQRYNALQRLLRNWADVGTRVFVIVEDVERLGADALAELESLTAADSEEEPGAHLVLMGGPKLRKFLESPTLARLKQRVRRSLILDPFTGDETRAYIAHQIREAGGDATSLFDNAAIDIVHACSNGIARVINTVSEAMLYQAAEVGAPKVTAALAFDVAREDFDYEGDLPGESGAPAEFPTDDTPAESVSVDPSPAFTDMVSSDLAASLVTADSSSDSYAPAETASPAESPGDLSKLIDAEPDVGADDDVPDLIQDTSPGMPAINPEAMLRNARRQPLTTPEELASLREKTDATQPSLPVLTSPDEPPADEVNDPLVDAAENAAANAHLEPRVPEPLSKSTDPADSQMIRALDDALRPDTQLLQTLEEPIAPAQDDKPVPLGLRPEIGATPPPPATDQDAGSAPGTAPSMREGAEGRSTDDTLEELPTLSTSMRIERKPDPVTSEPPAGSTEPVPPAPTVAVQAAAKHDALSAPEPSPAPVAAAQPEAAPEVSRPAAPAATAASGAGAALDAPDLQAALDTLRSRNVEAQPVENAATADRTLSDDEPTETPINAATETPAAPEPEPEPMVPKTAEPDTETPDPLRPEASTEQVERDIPETEPDKPEPSVATPTADNARAPETEIPPAAAAIPAPDAEPAIELGDDDDLPDLSLVPEITLDKKLEEHQQEAQAKIDEEAARMVELAAEKEDADEQTKAAAAETAKKREEEEQRKRIEKLAARFENAKSIEDVMDDTAAETLFGEEFSQIAAAVTAMHESQPPEAPADATEASNDAANIGAVADTEADSAAAQAAEPILELEPEPAAPAPAVAKPTQPAAKAAPPKPAPQKPAVPQAGKQTPPRPAPAVKPNMPDIESSAARRLEMVRALNQKAGKPMPRIPDEPGEEIVLGSEDSSPTCSGPQPEPIENQFGESMTAKLRALSAESIAQMQEEEEQEEKKAKKGGLLSRFRRG